MTFTETVLVYVFFVAIAGLFSLMFVMIWRSIWLEEKRHPNPPPSNKQLPTGH